MRVWTGTSRPRASATLPYGLSQRAGRDAECRMCEANVSQSITTLFGSEYSRSRTMSWMAFEQAEPELAAGGKKLLVNDDGDGVAFLATTNRLGHPQVAPVCPIFAAGNLYLCAAAHTPKHAN